MTPQTDLPVPLRCPVVPPAASLRTRGQAPQRSGVDLLADWLCAYGEYRVVTPLAEPVYRAVLKTPLAMPARPVFADLMRATGHSAVGGAPAEVV